MKQFLTETFEDTPVGTIGTIGLRNGLNNCIIALNRDSDGQSQAGD
jgi:hypothetical protein